VAFNRYAAGAKRYGMLRDMPNIGPVDPIGYEERDRKVAARKAAVQRRLQMMKEGKVTHGND
jgi:hypothetical protein